MVQLNLQERWLLLALVAQVFLTAVVWCFLLYGRVSTVVRKKIHPQKVADEHEAKKIYKDWENISDNLENLFEMPVLFYAGVLLIYLLKVSDLGMVALAWIFVVFRALHSWIHCTSNRISRRFRYYGISSFSLWILWARLGIVILF